MYSVDETELAGMGRRFVIATSSGTRLAIVVHESGTVEVYYTQPGEPQKTCPVATLTDEEARLVGAIIGGTIYRPEPIERLHKQGVVIRWHLLNPQAYAIGKTAGELLHDTGVVVLAAIEKDGKKQTSPPDRYVFQEGSQVALSGRIRDIEKVEQVLDKGQ